MNLEKKTTTFEAENNWAHFRICFRSFGHFTFFLAKHQYLFQNVFFKLQIFMTLIWLHSSSFLRIRYIHRSLRSLTSMKKGESWTLKFSSKFSFSTFCHLAFLWVSISGLFLTTNSFNYFCSKKESNIGNKQKKKFLHPCSLHSPSHSSWMVHTMKQSRWCEDIFFFRFLMVY